MNYEPIRYYENEGRKSVDRAKRAVKQLQRGLGPKTKARKIRNAALNKYVQARRNEDIGNATIRYELSILRKAFNLRREELGKVPSFPTVSVSNTRTGFFDESEVRKLVKYLPKADKAVAVFAFYTGWRIRSEILPLTWFQVDLDEGIVRLEPGTTKSGEGREFPFSEIPELYELLRKLKSEGDGPEVFKTSYRPFLDRWHEACQKIGKRGAWQHDLRRSAVR